MTLSTGIGRDGEILFERDEAAQTQVLLYAKAALGHLLALALGRYALAPLDDPNDTVAAGSPATAATGQEQAGPVSRLQQARARGYANAAL